MIYNYQMNLIVFLGDIFKIVFRFFKHIFNFINDKKDSNIENNPKISEKNRLVIGNAIHFFIYNNIDSIKNDFVDEINSKLDHLSSIKVTPNDLDQYINKEFNK